MDFEHDNYTNMPEPDDEQPLPPPAPPARVLRANAGVKGEFALAGFEITMQGATGRAVRYEFASDRGSGTGEAEST